MEDSFRLRVEKAFGSLPIPSSSSLWSLTEDEINNAPSTRRNRPEPETEPKPYPSSSGFKLDKDLEDLDEDVDAGAGPGPSKPPDYDDEQWEIKAGIGQDCTLDFEEEEDNYDKQAIGKEDTGDRLYMRDINDDDIGISSRNVLPTTFRDFGRDSRANHMAARIRLKQDDEAAKKVGALHVTEKSAPDNGSGGAAAAVNPKSILKSKDNPLEARPQKRVRFDSECGDRGDNDDEEKEGRDVRMKTSSMEEDAALNQSSKTREFESAVPDYIRNPSRYTCYTFDSSSDMDDKVNKEAYMSFLSRIKGSNDGSQSDDALDDLPSVTFIPKKKSGDVTMGENEVGSMQKLDVCKESMNRRAFPVSIASVDAENSDVSAMEEDEVEEAIEDTKKSSQKSNRKYRKKTNEEVEEPIV